MNFLKRAMHSLWYRKRSFLLLFCVFTVLSVLILGGFSVLSACNQQAKALREEIGASVIINNYHTETNDIFYGADLITQEDLRKIESDPLQAEQFVQNIQNMDIEDVDNYQFTIDTTQYRSMQGAIDSMTKLAAIMFAASILMGAVVLVMMLMINLKDREFELGVLLSMGENKAKIIAQMMLESLFPVLCAMTAAVFCSGWMQQIFASLFTAAVDISPTPITIFEMYLAGILLTLLASCVTVWKVTQYQPKRILMAME